MSKINEKKVKTKQKAVDDDSLMERFIKANDTCSHETCEKFIKIIKLNCQFCNKYFCTSHHLPEVHGCGAAAKKSASASCTKKLPNDEEKKLLEKKMVRKLEKMKNDRKKKPK